MTTDEANAIASETINYWIAHRLVMPKEAWEALGQGTVWHVDWWEVRVVMRRWLLRECGKASPLAA